MLLEILQSLEGEDIVVVDDGSDYSPIEHMEYCNYYRTEHKGKAGFWVLWNVMLEIAKESDDDWFIFTQDDVFDIQLDKVKQITKDLNKFAFNLMLRGKERHWTSKKWQETTINGVECWDGSYVDCVFATNRRSLDIIGWELEKVPIMRFFRGNNISSGVGDQLSKRFYKHNIPMYIPKKSFAYHGNHKSEMHPNRIGNHMVSK